MSRLRDTGFHQPETSGTGCGCPMSRFWDMGFHHPQKLGCPILCSLTAKGGMYTFNLKYVLLALSTH
jgi:hypothetical protein